MVKKIYYLANTKPDKNEGGIGYKIYKQMSLLRKSGFETHFIYIGKKKKWNKIASLLPFYSSKQGMEKLKKITGNTDIYIRYFFSDYKVIHYLKIFKKKNPHSKVAVEIPTYPYDGEKNLRKISPSYWKDLFWRRWLHKYIDKIVTYSDDDRIFNSPTLNISNGIDTDKISIRNPQNSETSINMIAVAQFGFWHGYDRMIEGLANYYKNPGKKREIKFYIVGYGNKEVEEQYRGLIEKYQLQKYVILTGKKTGAELDYYYNICDIGIDSMGRHRSKVYYNSSLKGKEYLAKGLPIVSGVKTELDKMPDFKYYLRVPANDDPVNIKKLIAFYDSVYKEKDKKIISENIRNFCVKNFNMDKCFEKVIVWYKKVN